MEIFLKPYNNLKKNKQIGKIYKKLWSFKER